VNTSIAKTKTGWQGNTRIDLGDNRILRIVTGRDMVSGLVTTAMVHRVVQEIDHRAEVHRARVDYGKRLIHWATRVTEKQVKSQHMLALDMVDKLKAEIAKHYEGV
jgi:hypothetical protein